MNSIKPSDIPHYDLYREQMAGAQDDLRDGRFSWENLLLAFPQSVPLRRGYDSFRMASDARRSALAIIDGDGLVDVDPDAASAIIGKSKLIAPWKALVTGLLDLQTPEKLAARMKEILDYLESNGVVEFDSWYDFTELLKLSYEFNPIESIIDTAISDEPNPGLSKSSQRLYDEAMKLLKGWKMVTVQYGIKFQKIL